MFVEGLQPITRPSNVVVWPGSYGLHEVYGRLLQVYEGFTTI